MLFSMALMLAIMSSIIELYVVLKFERIRRLMVRFPKVDIGISFFLSYILGTLFAAGGMVVLFAAILSTILSLFIYSTGVVEYLTPDRRMELAGKWQRGLDTFKGSVRFWWKVFTGPYRGYRYLRERVRGATSAARSNISRAKRAVHL